LGANARHILGTWIGQRYGTSFPYGTLVINVSGSFVIGLFLTLIAEGFVLHPNWRLFFAVGFLGAYTAFATFSYESVVLLPNGAWRLGLVNMGGSVVLGPVAVVMGMAVARLFWPGRGCSQRARREACTRLHRQEVGMMARDARDARDVTGEASYGYRGHR